MGSSEKPKSRLETDAPLRLGALIRSSISIRVHDSLTADDLAYRGQVALLAQASSTVGPGCS
jgi:hypothetical protein